MSGFHWKDNKIEDNLRQSANKLKINTDKCFNYIRNILTTTTIAVESGFQMSVTLGPNFFTEFWFLSWQTIGKHG
jgi:hypothetical protein